MRSELPQLMSVPETAAALGISTKTVRRMLEDGRLVEHRFGRNVRVNAASVMHLLWTPPGDTTSESQMRGATEAEVQLGPRLKNNKETTGDIDGMTVALGTTDELAARARLRAARDVWSEAKSSAKSLPKLKKTCHVVYPNDAPTFIKYRSADGAWKMRRIPAEHARALADQDAAEAYAARWACLQVAVGTDEPTRASGSPTGPSLQPSRGATTISDVGDKWFKGELTAKYGRHYVRDKKTSRDDECRFDKYIRPVIGAVPIASLRGERVAEAADLILQRMQDVSPGLSAATQRHVLQVFNRILTLAVFPLRLIPTNDLPPGYLPKARSQKTFSYVYPDEEAAVLKCTTVPLHYRLYFGILAREGMRASELRNLEWTNLDLERGVLRLDANKTGIPRAWRLDPGVLEALVRWKRSLSEKALERGYVIVNPKSGARFPLGKTAERYREALVAAGVSRPELFESSDSRMAIRGHDLRSTFVTISLAQGKTEAWVTDRTGHTSSTMLYRYKRAARTHVETELGALSLLSAAIPELTIDE